MSSSAGDGFGLVQDRPIDGDLARTTFTDLFGRTGTIGFSDIGWCCSWGGALSTGWWWAPPVDSLIYVLSPEVVVVRV